MCSLIGSLHSTHPGRASRISSCRQRPSPDARRTAERTAASWPCRQRLPCPTRYSSGSARPLANDRLLEALPLALPVYLAAYLPNVLDAGHCKPMRWSAANSAQVRMREPPESNRLGHTRTSNRSCRRRGGPRHVRGPGQVAAARSFGLSVVSHRMLSVSVCAVPFAGFTPDSPIIEPDNVSWAAPVGAGRLT